jgi:hypothetical protein
MKSPHGGVPEENRMEFRVQVTVEVDQVGNDMTTKTPVPLQVLYQAGQWCAQSDSPPISTVMYDTMQEAIVAGAKEAAAELRTSRTLVG